MTDDQLDRELEAALRIEPSPEFMARVRDRVAAQPRRSPFMRWAFEPVFALGVAAVVLAIVVPQVVRQPENARLKPGPANAAGSVRLQANRPPDNARLTPGPTTTPAAIARLKPGPTPHPAATARLKPGTTATVIVSPDEQQALQSLLRAAYQGRLPTVAIADPASEQPLQVPDINISPLVIERLPQIARLEEATEGEGQ
jgi:hypothetical protein